MVEQLSPQANFASHGTIINHRLAVRYPPSPATAARVFARVGGEGWPAFIQNLSQSGMSLLLDHAIDPKSSIVVEISNPKQGFFQLIQLKVSRSRMDHAGRYYVAGTFAPQLSCEDLHLLR
jgi:hypothetical protein